jgi:hypothetical protein
MDLRKTANEIREILKTEFVDQTVSFSNVFGYMPKLSRKRMHMPVIYQHGTVSLRDGRRLAVMKLQ